MVAKQNDLFRLLLVLFRRTVFTGCRSHCTQVMFSIKDFIFVNVNIPIINCGIVQSSYENFHENLIFSTGS